MVSDLLTENLVLAAAKGSQLSLPVEQVEEAASRHELCNDRQVWILSAGSKKLHNVGMLEF